MSERITSNSGILGGKPVLAGTRLSVAFLLELLADGATQAEILAAYPELSREGLEAALRYAARAMSNALHRELTDRA